jgi:hypothetical protein
MPLEPGALSRLARLRAEIDADRSALDARTREVEALLTRWARDGALAREPLIVLAVNLHGWYTALETLLERIARLYDQSVPVGASWHVELLSQLAVEVPSLRPAVLPAAVLPGLHELRRFRHFFRNAYVLELDPARVRTHADALVRLAPEVAGGLDRFREHLQRVIDAMCAC